MQLARISSQKQITIPSKLFQKLRLDVGDHIGITEEDGHLILTPYRLIPKDQLWFWTKEWQEMEREADDDIRAGRVSGPFTSAKELMKSLHAK